MKCLKRNELCNRNVLNRGRASALAHALMNAEVLGYAGQR